MCGLEVVEAWDGEECTRLVFAHDPSYFSVIIVRLYFIVLGIFRF